MHGDGNIAFIILLELEGDGDAISQVQGMVIVGAFPSASEEANVMHSQEFGAALLRLGDLRVFTRSHCKEEGTDCELADGCIQCGVLESGECPKDAWSEGLLRFLGWILVRVSFQLAL
jgi:hypothetical protein